MVTPLEKTMGRKIERYNNSEFALGNVYDRLTTSIRQLPPETAVDAYLDGAHMLKVGIDQLIEKFYQGAEVQQTDVMGERAATYKRTAESVLQLTKNGDLTAIDDALQQSIEASLQCKESATKMRHIKARGYERYDSQKEMESYLRKLDKIVSGNGNGAKQIEILEE